MAFERSGLFGAHVLRHCLFLMIVDGLRWTPIGFLLAALCSVAGSGWLAAGLSGSSSAPAHETPGPATGQRDAGVREAIGRLEDSLEQCCAPRTAEAPTTVCKCGLGDTLGDLLHGFALGAGSFALAAFTWACRCCGLIGRALPLAGRPALREHPEKQPLAVEAGTASPNPPKRRAGRGGALAHLAVEPSQLD